MPRRAPPQPLRHGGYTYLGLMIMIAVLGVGLAATGMVWRTSQQREREKDLLSIGTEVQAAIAAYYQQGRQFPHELMDLVEDTRWPEPRHFLRRIYKDPMTNAADWTLIRDNSGDIMGIASRSQATPIKKAGFRPEQEEVFGQATSYAEWQFIYVPKMGRLPAPGSGK